MRRVLVLLMFSSLGGLPAPFAHAAALYDRAIDSVFVIPAPAPGLVGSENNGSTQFFLRVKGHLANSDTAASHDLSCEVQIRIDGTLVSTGPAGPVSMPPNHCYWEGGGPNPGGDCFGTCQGSVYGPGWAGFIVDEKCELPKGTQSCACTQVIELRPGPYSALRSLKAIDVRIVRTGTGEPELDTANDLLFAAPPGRAVPAVPGWGMGLVAVFMLAAAVVVLGNRKSRMT